MSQIKKPIKLKTVELPEKPEDMSQRAVYNNPGVNLLLAYLEKREILDEDERIDILALIKEVCLPKYVIEMKRSPIEEDWLAKKK
jgi:hypothetical protein